ncbi:MAG: 1,4-alpha-glucan branching enzyme, partial [Desulfonatronovibrio sp.]
MFTESDIYLFKEGRHFRLYEHLGAQVITHGGVRGVYFGVWAPNAKSVSVMGDFNYWNPDEHRLNPRTDGSGIWEGFVAQAMPGHNYKFHVQSRFNNYQADKGDPFAFFWETSPKTASKIWKMDYQWKDKDWMEKRGQINGLDQPAAIYEMHLGSWRRDPNDPHRFLSYIELARVLPKYLKEMGYTHVEFLPVCEHPFYGSWGYQCLGFFAPTSRYGTPQEFMHLIDALHQEEIGVILDWVPSHFPTDEYGLGYFDGTHLYEHMDPRKGFHPDWKSFIFNYGRNEVVNFLISSAMFWLDKYHIDGFRLDAVASMLYLDYSRDEGEWIPNEYGGNENLDAIEFLKLLNSAIYQNFPDVQTFAEESTSWPMVSKPTYVG